MICMLAFAPSFTSKLFGSGIRGRQKTPAPVWLNSGRSGIGEFGAGVDAGAEVELDRGLGLGVLGGEDE